MNNNVKLSRGKTTALYYQQQQRNNKKSRYLAPNSKKKQKSRTLRRSENRELSHLKNTSPANSSTGISPASLGVLGLLAFGSITITSASPVNRYTHNTDSTQNNNGNTSVNLVAGTSLAPVGYYMHPNATASTNANTNIGTNISTNISTTTNTTGNPSYIQRSKQKFLSERDKLRDNNNNITKSSMLQNIQNTTRSTTQTIHQAVADFKDASKKLDAQYYQMQEKELSNNCDLAKDSPKSNIAYSSFREAIAPSAISAGISLLKPSGSCALDKAAGILKKKAAQCFMKQIGSGVVNASIDKIIEGISDWGSAIIKNLAEIAKNFKDKNQQIIDVIAINLVEKTTEFQELLMSLVIHINDSGESIDNHLDFINEQIDTLFDAFDSTIDEYKTFLNSTTSSIQSYDDDLHRLTNDISERIEQTSREIKNNFDHRQNTYTEQVNQEATEQLSRLDPALEEARDQLNEIHQVNVKIKQYIHKADPENLVESYGSKLRTLTKASSDFVNEVIEPIVSFFEIYKTVTKYKLFFTSTISLLLIFKGFFGNARQKKIIIENRGLLSDNTKKLSEVNDIMEDMLILHEKQKSKQHRAGTKQIEQDDIPRFEELHSLPEEELRRTLAGNQKQMLDTYEEIEDSFKLL